jgi:type I site-specific restriction-modification system R (restriction) subunit
MTNHGINGCGFDIYDIKQSVDDGATVPISYESRLVKIKLDEQTTKKRISESSLVVTTRPLKPY